MLQPGNGIRRRRSAAVDDDQQQVRRHACIPRARLAGCFQRIGGGSFAGRVHQGNVQPADLRGNFHKVSCGARYVADQDTIFSGQAVHQRALAGVGRSDDRDRVRAQQARQGLAAAGQFRQGALPVSSRLRRTVPGGLEFTQEIQPAAGLAADGRDLARRNAAGQDQALFQSHQIQATAHQGSPKKFLLACRAKARRLQALEGHRGRDRTAVRIELRLRKAGFALVRPADGDEHFVDRLAVDSGQPPEQQPAVLDRLGLGRRKPARAGQNDFQP